MKMKAPPPRGFTLADKRTLKLEKRSLPLTVLVALFAAVISFDALWWVGVEQGIRPQLAPLLPLTIDGLGIICSLGIIRSASAGEPWRKRASEWIGLCLALSLSMVGNAYHALRYVPDWLTVVNSIAVPAIVAYSIHVLGRYLDSGLSAHIMADEPDKLHANVWQLGDGDAQQTAQPAPRTSAPPARTAPVAPRTPTAQDTVDEARSTAQRAPEDAPGNDEGPEQVAQLVRAHVAAHGTASKPSSAAIHRELGFTHHPATTRRWVKDAYDATVQSIEGTAPDDEPVEQDRALSTAS